MKAIVIKDCLDCPLKHISQSGKVFCSSAATALKRPRLRDQLVGTITTKTPIPSWCPLSNFTDRITEYFLDNKIEIPEKLRALTLQEEGRSTNVTETMTEDKK